MQLAHLQLHLAMLSSLAVSSRDALLAVGHCVFQFGDRAAVQNYTTGMQDLVSLIEKLQEDWFL